MLNDHMFLLSFNMANYIAFQGLKKTYTLGINLRSIGFFICCWILLTNTLLRIFVSIFS